MNTTTFMVTLSCCDVVCRTFDPRAKYNKTQFIQRSNFPLVESELLFYLEEIQSTNMHGPMVIPLDVACPI